MCYLRSACICENRPKKSSQFLAKLTFIMVHRKLKTDIKSAETHLGPDIHTDHNLVLMRLKLVK